MKITERKDVTPVCPHCEKKLREIYRIPDSRFFSQKGSRAITPRGDLAAIETTTAALFERAAPSVTYIYTRSGSPLQTFSTALQGQSFPEAAISASRRPTWPRPPES